MHALHASAHEERHVFWVACATFLSGYIYPFVMLMEAPSHHLCSNIACVGDEAGQFIIGEFFFFSPP
jgi:hypothetical protein